RAGYESRAALRDEEAVNKELGLPSDRRLRTTTSRINAAVEPLVKAMLFSGETALTSPVSGTSSFDVDFASQGPKDRRGRSLRALDLKTRLMKYPCSYLIYSDAFDGLPVPARESIYEQLWKILSGI